MAETFLQELHHRPWPLPSRPWLWRQRWDQVLLLHYRVPRKWLRPKVPVALEIDEHEGSAWLSLVPFRMRRVRPHGLPALWPVSDFVELNLRTYVTLNNRAGVYFLDVEAGSRLAAWLARTFSPLPYRYSPLSWRAHGDGVSFLSPDLRVHFAGGRPLARKGARDLFLTERYCFYAAQKRGIVRADVHHVPWPLVEPRVVIERNAALEPRLVRDPLHADAVHFSPGVEIVGWSAEPAI